MGVVGLPARGHQQYKGQVTARQWIGAGYHEQRSEECKVTLDKADSKHQHSQLLGARRALMYFFGPPACSPPFTSSSRRARAEITYRTPGSLGHGCLLGACSTSAALAWRSTQLWWRPHEGVRGVVRRSIASCDKGKRLAAYLLSLSSVLGSERSPRCLTAHSRLLLGALQLFCTQLRDGRRCSAAAECSSQKLWPAAIRAARCELRGAATLNSPSVSLRHTKRNPAH